MKKAIFLSVILLGASLLSPLHAQEQGPAVYKNEQSGITMTGPQSWYMTTGDTVKEAMMRGLDQMSQDEALKDAAQNVGPLVVFSQYPFGSPREYNPSITVTSEPLNVQYIKTAMDYAQAAALSVRAMFKDAEISEQPQAVKIGERDGVRFAYVGTPVVMGYLQLRLQSLVFVFIEGDTVYSISCTDSAENFAQNKEIFEKSARSFTLGKG